MTDETLDETLDRIAGEMTAVAADPSLASRVRQQMRQRYRPWLMPTLVTASMAGVLALSLIVTRPAWQGGEPEARALSGRALAPLTPLAVAVPRSDVSRRPVAAARPSPIAWLDEAPLAVAALIVPPLAMPEAGEIAPLHVESLQIAEIEFEPSKEPR